MDDARVAEEALKGTTVNAPARELLPRPRRHFTAFRRDERGQALVEFALVVPILLLLVIGIFDFGQALNYYNQESQLVGQGARAAAVNRCPDGTEIGGVGGCTSIQQQISETYANGALKNNPICIDPYTPGAGKPVTVRTTYDFQLLGFIGGATIHITASQTERQEIKGTYSSGCQS